MENKRKDYSFYLISDEKKNLIKRVKKAIKYGVKVVQLRLKNANDKSFLKKAIKLKKLCKKHNVLFIINDRIAIAMKIKADGLHLGQKDLDIKKAKKSFKGMIGISCNTLKEAKKAEKQGASYIGLGAVFKTNSKDNAKVIGLEKFKKISQKISIPIVAIGGININNAKKVLRYADGIAVISAILSAKNIKKESKKLSKLIKKTSSQ